MTLWKRMRPHWKGIYISKLGKISRISDPKGSNKWLLEPVPKYYYCKTLKEAKELAEEMQP